MLLSIKKENPLLSKSWSTPKEKQHVLAEKRGEGENKGVGAEENLKEKKAVLQCNKE